MEHIRALFQMAGGHELAEEDDGPARRMQIVLLAAGASALLSAVYGFAVAGGVTSHALANLYRVPMVVLLASAGAVPAALVAWRLIGCRQRASDLVLGMAAGTFSGALILAVLAPIVGLYYATSTWLGPVLALLTAGLGLMVGMIVMVRSVVRRATAADTGLLRRYTPVLVMMGVHFITILQLVSVSSIMVESTFLDNGIEGVAGR